MIVLHSPAGRALELERRLWLSALREAGTMGWRPAGTGAPPRPLGARSAEQWQGEYGAACGQEVTRDDARELGLALARSGKAEYGALRAFSLASGFLVCEPAGLWQLQAAVNSLGQQPEQAPGGRRSARPELVREST